MLPQVYMSVASISMSFSFLSLSVSTYFISLGEKKDVL
jgi:hypothetical protein